MNPTEAMLREMAELRTFHPGWTFASTWEQSCVRAANVLDDLIRNWAASNA